ncbi:MAG: dolichyl-phosphate beta-glucosyltransferase [Desulfatibacillaceae bacterium]
MIDLSIVIPAYNEQDRIVTCLENTLEYLDGQPYESEVVVVSDGSSDNTVEVAAGFADKYRPNVRALEYHPNRGKGYAVSYGMVRASGARVLFMDADYAVPISEIHKAFGLMDAGYDVALASRAIKGAKVDARQSLPRQLSARLYTLVQNLYLGMDWPDTQCGFKMFTRQAARDLFSRQKLSSVIFDAEILWLAKKRGYTAAQFPVRWRHVGDSRIQYDSLGKSLFVFRELFRIRGLHPDV